MYQEDMVNHGDGYGGMPLPPKVSVANPKAQEPYAASQHKEQEGEDTSKSAQIPYNHSEFATDPNLQRQHRQHLPPTGIFQESQPPAGRPSQPMLPPFNQTVGPAPATDSTYHRSRTTSRSPSRRRPSSSRSLSPRRSASPRHSISRRNSADAYHLMPMETEKPTRRRSQSSVPDTERDQDEKFVAQIALGVQLAMVFFCLLILIAVAMAISSQNGYWVVIVVSLAILVTLLLSLCCFLYKVINEEDAPRINQKHMPKWYRTLTKLIKEEMTDFREDWLAFSSDMLLLEDGDAGMETLDSSQTVENEIPQKPKKRRGKSALFKMVAKPVSVLAGFRRRRKEKKKQKKGQPFVAEPSFPSTV